MNDINEKFSSEDYWSSAWVRHIEGYLNAPPRAGIWLEKVFPDKCLTILESAGGSCRDSRYLFERGYKSLGTDFDHKTLSYIKKSRPASNFVMQREDAFNFSFHDDAFDIVFHNGFWVLFEDDEDIKKLLLEQARVCKKYLVILVHNSENTKNRELFEQKSKLDDLYKIRFFSRSELTDIIELSGLKQKKIIFKKFGSHADRLYQIEKRFTFFGFLNKFFVPLFYTFYPWAGVERIGVIVELDNKHSK